MSGITGSKGIDPEQLKAEMIAGADPIGASGGQAGVDEVEGQAVVNQARMRASGAASELAMMARLLDAEDKARGGAAGLAQAPVKSVAAGTEEPLSFDLGPGGLIDLSKMPRFKEDLGAREFTVDHETFFRTLENDPGALAAELARLARADPPTAYLEAMEWLRYVPNQALKLLPVLPHVGGPGGGRLQGDMILFLRDQAQEKADGRISITHDIVTKATAAFLQSNPVGFLGYLEGSPTLQKLVPEVLKPVLKKGSGGEKIVGEALAAVSTEAARAADAAGRAAPGGPEERAAIDQAQSLGALLSHVETAIEGLGGDEKARIRTENRVMGFALDVMGKAVDVVVPQASAATKVVFGQLKGLLERRLDDVDKDVKRSRNAMVDVLLGTFEAVNDPMRSRSNSDPTYRTAYRIYRDNLTEGRKDTMDLDGR